MISGSLGAGGLSAASATALRGTTTAIETFDAAAQETARVGTEVPADLRAMPAPDTATGTGLLELQETPDLARSSVAGMVAQRAYELNLSVVRSADEMTGEALRMLG